MPVFLLIKTPLKSTHHRLQFYYFGSNLLPQHRYAPCVRSSKSPLCRLAPVRQRRRTFLFGPLRRACVCGRQTRLSHALPPPRRRVNGFNRSWRGWHVCADPRTCALQGNHTQLVNAKTGRYLHLNPPQTPQWPSDKNRKVNAEQIM